MPPSRSVLIVGLDPALIDFSHPDYAAFPGLTAAKVQGALEADQAKLCALGYDAELCLTDFGATAEAVLGACLQRRSYDCVLVGAGVRTVARHFLLFERLINAIHRQAPQARICFNTRPDDTADAVQRWV